MPQGVGGEGGLGEPEVSHDASQQGPAGSGHPEETDDEQKVA